VHRALRYWIFTYTGFSRILEYFVLTNYTVILDLHVTGFSWILKTKRVKKYTGLILDLHETVFPGY
jgi:hypothetical protein